MPFHFRRRVRADADNGRARPLRHGAAGCCLVLLISFVACSPPPFADGPQAIGPVVEIAHGDSGTSAWTLKAFRSARGTCVQIANGTGCGDAVDSGAVPMSIGGSGSNDTRWVSGQVAADVATVRILLDSGASLDLTPVAAPAGSGLGPLFVGGVLPAGTEPTAYLALGANGTVLLRLDNGPAAPASPTSTR